MARVLVVAIHHGEIDRAPVSRLLDEWSRNQPRFLMTELWEQAPLSDCVDVQALVTWARGQWDLEKRWRRYRGVDSLWRECVAWLGRRLWVTRLRASRRFRVEAWRARQIEERVTKKHVAAWRSLDSSDCQACLVVEADAVWVDGVSENVADVALGLNPEDRTYINFAGGLSEFWLRTSGLRDAEQRRSGLVSYSRPVTDTSCAYLMTKALVKEMLSLISREAERMELGVDWLLNWAFMELTGAGLHITCLHASPPMVLHGSRTGITQSWHPAR